MTEVTPRPWHIPPGPWWQDPNDNRIHDAAGNDVLDYLPVTEIGKRVNAHDALVAALVCAEADLEGLAESELDDHPAWQTLKEIRAALEAAK